MKKVFINDIILMVVCPVVFAGFCYMDADPNVCNLSGIIIAMSGMNFVNLIRKWVGGFYYEMN